MLNLLMKYFSKQKIIHKSIFALFLKYLLDSNDIVISRFAARIILSSKNRSLKLGYDNIKNLFYIIDGEERVYFGNLKRGLDLYSQGFKSRGTEIFNSYCLSYVDFRCDDIVIDCGANYGDLWLALRGLINMRGYISFEPGDLEFQSLTKNVPQGIHNNYGLGAQNTTMGFYVNEQNADSSFVEPAEYSEQRFVRVMRLSDYVNENEIKRIKLLKLEAEGYEPEILKGALDIIDRVMFIAVDGGNERGVECQETFSSLCNVLLRLNFKLIETNFAKGRALFVNKDAVSEVVTHQYIE